jgi:hypothetical protein
MIVMNWIMKSPKFHNIRRIPILDEVFNILDSFDSFSIRHVYKERNMEAYSLSKARLSLDHGQWRIKETKDGTHYKYFHRLFIEPIGPPGTIL